MSFERDLLRFPEAINDEDYVIATYYLETPMDLYKAANAFAAEQSTGTWQRVGYETDAMREKHGIKVVGIYKLPYEPTGPNLPTGTKMSEFGAGNVKINAAVLRLAFPHINFGPKIPNLLTAVAGNLYEMGAFTAIKLLDLEFPDSFLKEFTGPRFGIEGTRKIIGVYDRPIVGAIIKPCVGISPKQIAELAYQGAKGGLDFIKDDELIADTKYNSVKARVKTIVKALKRAEDETGEKTMYAFNITDRMDRIRELHDIVVEGGGNCVMINAATAGLEAMRELAEYTQVPIHCHRDFAPMWTRSPYLGISFTCLTKLFRLSGADQTHCGAISGKLYETDEEVLRQHPHLHARVRKHRPLHPGKLRRPVGGQGGHQQAQDRPRGLHTPCGRRHIRAPGRCRGWRKERQAGLGGGAFRYRCRGVREGPRGARAGDSAFREAGILKDV